MTPVRQIHPATVAIVLPSGALPSPLDAIHESAMRGVTLLYDTQSGAPQDAPVTTAVDGGNIRVMTGR
ncbi:MAG TPA: hypothetical protein VIK41_14985 [Gemmatimonadaceae bacterium]